MALTITPDIHQTFLSSQAKEFRETYRVGNSISRESRSRQKDLIVEEFKEFLQADNMLFRTGSEPKAHCLKELSDLVYVCYQYAANQGWDLDEALHRVHESNMSKLDKDGKPIFRQDGKVLKGPNYAPPNLEDLV